MSRVPGILNRPQSVEAPQRATEEEDGKSDEGFHSGENVILHILMHTACNLNNRHTNTSQYSTNIIAALPPTSLPLLLPPHAGIPSL